MVIRMFIIISFVSLLLGGQAVQAKTIVQEREFELPTNRSAEVRLDVDAGQVFVEHGPGSVCKIYLEYTEGKFSEEMNYNERRDRLKIQLDSHGLRFLEKRDRHDSDEDNVAIVRITLPEEVKIAFESKIKAGEIEMTVGNLMLTTFDFQAWAGEVKIDFDMPNRVRMEYLGVNVKVGETRLRYLGNANFEEANINGGIGQMEIDFSGSKIEQAVAYIDLDIGETYINLPEQVGVKMQINKFLFMSDIELPSNYSRKGRFIYSPNYQDSDKTLYLRISPGLGQLTMDENGQQL